MPAQGVNTEDIITNWQLAIYTTYIRDHQISHLGGHQTMQIYGISLIIVHCNVMTLYLRYTFWGATLPYVTGWYFHPPKTREFWLLLSWMVQKITRGG